MYLKKQNTPFSVQHKNANHEFFTIICFGNQKKTKKNTRKEPKAFLESAKCFQCARCPGQKYRDVSSRQLTIAAFSLPKGSKVEHSWVLYTLQ